MDNLKEYIGCIHGHSVYSDGSGTYPEIIKAGQDSDLDYLMMSDHMNLKGLENGFRGWHDKLFMSIGYEINDPSDQHHYLAFGLKKTLRSGLEHQEYIQKVKKLKGLGIAAHPFEERDSKKSLKGYPPISWKTLEYPEIEVIELWNMMSHWMEKTTLKNLLWNLFHPRSFSTFPKKNLLQWWDGANLTKKVTAVGSVDVHAKIFNILGIYQFKIFDYKVMFKSIRTHILLENDINSNLPDDIVENSIFNAIQKGSCFISNFRRGEARGFRFWVENDNEKYNMGDELYSNEVKLFVKIPKTAICKVFRNGEIYKIIETKELELIVPNGLYRIEVELKNRGWIYSNHINILKD